jgi:hypothetical protein
LHRQTGYALASDIPVTVKITLCNAARNTQPPDLPKQQSSFIYKAKRLSSRFSCRRFPHVMPFYKAALFRETALHQVVKICAADISKSCIMHASHAG